MTQRKRPCKTCPFRKTVTPGELGGSPVEEFVGQTHGPFMIPCHSHIDYSDPDWNAKAREEGTQQCAGAALFRENVGMDKLLPDMLRIDVEGADEVFATVDEFASHHLEKQVNLNHWQVASCVEVSMAKASVTGIRPKE